ncbi:MAG: hypothetical protein EXR95_05070 [Gemmatimonadetes bacterium]|nr:hypothetical protein [Gemmatimonadota bacterium]
MIRSLAASTVALALLAVGLAAQQPAAGAAAAPRPARVGTPVPLAIRADWRPAEVPGRQEPLSQSRLAGDKLKLHMYGSYLPEGLLFSHQFAEQVPHVFNGLCQITCALLVSDKDNYVDLSGLGKVRLVSFINGLHQVRVVLRLGDGTMLMSDQVIGPSSDYRVSELVMRDIRWRRMNPERVVEDADGKWFEPGTADLSRVDQVGWTDMAPGISHGSGGYANVGWIEAYGVLVPRATTSSK